MILYLYQNFPFICRFVSKYYFNMYILIIDDKLQNTVGGGKPKMKYYFNTDAKTWPVQTIPGLKEIPVAKTDQDKLVGKLLGDHKP